MAEKFELHKRRHPDYLNQIDNWNFFISAYKGGTGFVSDHLFTHRLENGADFINRKARAYYLNYCRPLPNIYTEYLYKNQVTRPKDFLEVQENIDGQGTGIGIFMPKVATLASIYGQCHVVVDMARDNEGISKAEAKQPYVSIYTPEHVVDWSRNPENGQLRWVLLHEPEYIDDNPMQARALVNKYRLMTTEGWEVYGINKKGKSEIIDSGTWNLGVVPLATCYHRDIDTDMIGESMLVDIAPVNRIVMNWCSCLDEQIERQTFSQLVMQEGLGTSSDGKALKGIGTAAIFTYPADAKNAPSYISPDTSQLETIWQMIERHVGEIYRMAVLEKSGDAMMVAQSGIAKAYDFVDTNGAMISKATAMERFENELFTILAAWNGKSELNEDIKYDKDFDVINMEKDIKNSLDLVAEGISGTFNSLIYKRLVRRSLTNATQRDLTVIDKEIDVSGGGISSNVNMEHDEHDNEDGDVPAKDISPEIETKPVDETKVVEKEKVDVTE